MDPLDLDVAARFAENHLKLRGKMHMGTLGGMCKKELQACLLEMRRHIYKNDKWLRADDPSQEERFAICSLYFQMCTWMTAQKA